MSYEPLHHKYRPKTFADLVGQEAIATTLSNALRLSKIAPAYLFAGPRGTGKTSSARILAKSLNCLESNAPTDRPCGVCEVCRSIANGSSLDVVEIDAASNTGVDNIRELIERSQFAPVQCRHKVYIIDECLTGDSLVLTSEGWWRIDDPTIQTKQVLSYHNFSGYWEFKPVLRWFDQGVRPTLIVQTTNQEIRCTANHLIRTETGWVAAENLQPGMRIVAPDMEIISEYLDFRQVVAGNKYLNHRHSTQPETLSHFKLKHKGHSEIVHSISEGKPEKVYDIEVQDYHNFVANGLNVHNCHSLSASSFNALLKTLEEPPSHVVFVLATTDPQRVLPTIISRCQRFDFRRIPLEAMVQHLQHISQAESISIRPEALLTVAQIAQGGLRDAESMLDQLSLLSGEVTVEKVWDLVGAVPEQDLMNLLQAIADDNPEAVLDRARGIMDRGREPLVVLQNLTSFYRDLLIAKTAGDRVDLVAITPATWEQLRQFAQTQEVNHILQGQQHLRACEVQIKNTTQPRLWLEVALLGLLPSALSATTQVVTVTSPRTTSPQSVAPSTVAAPAQPATQQQYTPTTTAIQTQGQTPAPQTSQPVATVPPAASTPPVANSSATSNLESLWQQVLTYLPLASQKLLEQQGNLIDVKEHEVRLGFRSQNLIKIAAEPKLPQIKAAFSQVLGRQIQVHLEVFKGNTAQPAQTSPAQRQPATTQVQSQTFTPTQTPPSQTPPKQPGFYNSEPSPEMATKKPVSPPLPTPTGFSPTSPLKEDTETRRHGDTEREDRDRSNVQSKSAPTPTETTVNLTKKPSTAAFVDESEAIAAAHKLADMFGGTVVEDIDDLDRFHSGSDEQNDPMILEGSNPIEDLPDLAEEIVEEEEEGTIAPLNSSATRQPSTMQPPISLPKHQQQPTENFPSPAEEEEKQLLQELTGEEYGGCGF